MSAVQFVFPVLAFGGAVVFADGLAGRNMVSCVLGLLVCLIAIGLAVLDLLGRSGGG